LKLRLSGWIALPAVALPCLATTQPADSTQPTWEYDPENAQDVLETCAGCHGRNGDGGKDGTYPRLAGLKEEYIAKQLRAFKERERANIPMYPYATERELPESDIRDIARLLSEIELPTEMPPPDAPMTALERLRAAQAVFDVPRVDGDVERGADLYVEECSDCHGPEGWGEDDAPQIAGQYTEYLRRQIASFQSGERLNEDMEGVFEELDERDLQDIFAYLSERD
jgi:cytochrome c553